MVRPENEEEIREMVRGEADRLGSMTALAREMGVSLAYVSDFLGGRRGVGPAFRKHFGLRVKATIVQEKGG